MPASSLKIASNLRLIHDRIAGAAARAGRDPGQVRLVAVTKSVGIDEIRVLIGLGVTHLGENRVEIAREKILACRDGVCWHLIGNIQRRKVRDAVELFDRIDAVDRLSLAEALERRCAGLGRVMPVLLEVNVSGEASKHGFQPGEVGEGLRRIQEFAHLRVEGLMTMAPYAEDPETVRPVFARLRELAATLDLNTLSMGMTNDFEIAVEEGATEVRIGAALFQ